MRVVVFRYDGPDISSFQPPGDWSAVASTGAQFAGIRLGNGPFSEWSGGAVRVHPGFVDPHAVENLVDARSAGMRWRALYYVITPLETPQQALERILGFFALVGGPQRGDLIALDYEGNPNRGPDGELVAPDEWCSADEVEAYRGHWAQSYGSAAVGLYCSRGWMDRVDRDPFGWRWLASYTLDVKQAALDRGCEMFQWTSSAVIDGIAAGRVDMNEILDPVALDAAASVEENGVGSPQGSLDVVEALGGGRYRMVGWAYDADVPGLSIEAHLYLNGVHVATAMADRERDDVNAALGITGQHGFDAVATLQVQADVYGINVGGGENAHVGGQRVALVAESTGSGGVGDTGPTGPTGPPGPAGAGGTFDPEAVRSLVRAEIAATPFETKAVPPGP